MEDIKDNIVDYFSRRKFLTLATSNTNGEPLTHPVAYVNDGATVFFITNINSRKVKNIIDNPNVAYSIYDNTEYLDEIKSLQMEGKASILDDEKKSKELLNMLNKKFPASDYLSLSVDSVFIKI